MTSVDSEISADAAEEGGGLDPALRRLMLVVVIGMVMSILDTTIVNVAINTLGRDFHTSLSTIQWVLTGYTLALSMTIPLTGWALSRFGNKTAWIGSLAMFTVGSALCGAAWSPTSLIVFRVLQGIGGGLIMPVGQAMLARAAGPERMGRVMGVVAVPAMAGPVLGPLIGGLIVDHLDWRWMFYVNVPISVVAIALAVRLLPHDRDRDRSVRLDALGLALLSPGLAGLIYGLSEAGNGQSITSPQTLVSVIAGAVLVAAFVLHALRRRKGALVDVRLFRRRPFATGVGALILYVGAVFGLMIVLPLYFQLVRHYSPLQTGLLTAPLGLGAIITMPIAGRLSDRRNTRGIAAVGILIVLAASVVYTQMDTATAVALLAGALFVVGIGHGLVAPSLMSAAYQGLPREEAAAATTASNIAMRVGMTFGTAVLAVVLQIAIRQHVPGASGSLAGAAALHTPNAGSQLTQSFAESFWWAFAFGAVALIPTLLVPPRKTAPAEPAQPEPTAASTAAG